VPFKKTLLLFVKMSYSVYRNFDTVRRELSLKCPTLILKTTREDFDASVEAFDLKKTGMGPRKNKITMSNADGDVATDSISNFLNHANQILTIQQKEEVRQKLVVTNRLVFVREHASVEKLTSLFAFDIKLSCLSTLQLCMNVGAFRRLF